MWQMMIWLISSKPNEPRDEKICLLDFWSGETEGRWLDTQHFGMSLVVRKPVFGVSRSHTNRSLQPHKIAKGLKFRIKKVEGLYYLCSKNKGAYQLHSHREADLRLCFC